MEPKERTAARRLTIYKHLARRVGYAPQYTRNDLDLELAHQIARFCHHTDEATPIDGYRVWCEINDIPLKDEGLGSLFAHSIPTADEKLRQLYMDVELEKHRLMRQREQSVRKEEQKKLREYLSTRDEEDDLNELNKEYQPNALEQALVEEYEEYDEEGDE